MIRTVQGDIPPQSIGHVQCHEHIWLQRGPSASSNPALCMDNYQKSLTELISYQQSGGSLIVDAQPGFFGRDAAVLHQLSVESRVHIVASTGFHKLQFAESDCPLFAMSLQSLTDFFVEEITSGMYLSKRRRCTAKAGIIKVAQEATFQTDPLYARLWTAALEAHKKTGAPLLVHTEASADITALIDFLASNNITLQNVILCHLDRTHHDYELHKSLLARGCYLCYDSIHRLKYVSTHDELNIIREMCTAGYDSQILLSLDTTNQRLRSYYAKDMGLDYLFTDYIFQMRSRGISDTSIEKMCRTNAATALDITAVLQERFL